MISFEIYIITSDINCFVLKVKYDKSQSNHDVWVATLLSRNTYTLIMSYNFYPSSKRSIGIRASVMVLISSGTIAEGNIVEVTLIVP